jgi:hypothetical protein
MALVVRWIGGGMFSQRHRSDSMEFPSLIRSFSAAEGGTSTRCASGNGLRSLRTAGSVIAHVVFRSGAVQDLICARIKDLVEILPANNLRDSIGSGERRIRCRVQSSTLKPSLQGGAVNGDAEPRITHRRGAVLGSLPGSSAQTPSSGGLKRRVRFI